jgi:type I restriction enzyme, S subunit
VKSKLKPEIRFTGFAEEWEECKFEDMYDVVSGFAFKRSDYVETGVPIINGESIQHGSISGRNLNFLPKEFLDKYHHLVLDTDDIVLGLNRPITNGHLKIARVPKDLDGSLLYQRAGKIIILNDTDINFSYQLLEKEISQFVLKEAVGSDQPFISTSKLKKWLITVPFHKEEQMEIGEFYYKMNQIISLHQQELTTLKQTKKGFLQKMFPKEGESVPEVRFPGFTGKWEHIRLGDSATIKGRLGWKSLKQEEYISEGPSMIAGRHIKNGVIDWNIVDHIPQWRYDESPEIMLENGDVIFSKDGSLGNPALISDLNILATINSTMMLVRVNETTDPSFFYQVMKSEKFERLIHLKVSGSSIPHLFQADMNEFLFVAPVKEEQIKIGKFFKQLDDVIALHQRELDSLKETKKAFLQKMFV